VGKTTPFEKEIMPILETINISETDLIDKYRSTVYILLKKRMPFTYLK